MDESIPKEFEGGERVRRRKRVKKVRKNTIKDREQHTDTIFSTSM